MKKALNADVYYLVEMKTQDCQAGKGRDVVYLVLAKLEPSQVGKVSIWEGRWLIALALSMHEPARKDSF